MARSTILRASIPVAVSALVVVACASGTGDRERLGTVSGAQSCPAGKLLQGVDTSSGQGTVDWSSAKSAGVSWVIMKATQGTYDDDSAFPKNWGPAKAAGVVRGAYHFFDPTEDGVAQANYFLAAMGALDAEDLSPMLDVECPEGTTVNCLGFSGGTGVAPAADIRTRMLDWLATVEAATGRKPIIYTYGSFFADSGANGAGTNIDTTGLDAYPLWIASYPASATAPQCYSVPAPWTEAAIWQYGDTGSFAGIAGNVDVDRMVGPIDALLGWPAARRASRADLDGDGRADVCGRDPSGITCALAGSGGTFGAPFAGPAWSDKSGWRPEAYASTIQFADVNGDGRGDVCARAAAGITCAASTGSGFGPPFAGPAWSDAAGWAVPAAYATVQLADVDGDGKADVCGRGAAGITCAASTGSGFGAPFAGPAWSDAAGWNEPSRYRTIRFPDVDGDGRADVCGRAADGIHCAFSTGSGFGAEYAGPGWSDAEGWSAAAYASTIQFPDVDGDGKSDACARAAAGITCALSGGTTFGPSFAGPAWSDAAGWNVPSSYATIVYLDLDGDGRADVCGRAKTGMVCALSTGTGFGATFDGPAWSDAAGWGEARYYGTIAGGDVNGDGMDDLCARAAAGWICAPSTGSGFGPALPGPGWSDLVWGIAPYWGTASVVGQARRGGISRDGGAGDGGVAPLGDGAVTSGFDASVSVSASVSASGGCSCRASGEDGRGEGLAGVALGLAFATARRRARRPEGARG